jgi:hypothetical protein
MLRESSEGSIREAQAIRLSYDSHLGDSLAQPCTSSSLFTSNLDLDHTLRDRLCNAICYCRAVELAVRPVADMQ